MVFSDDFKKKINMLFAVGILLIASIFLFFQFDIYYDLNDDIVIKEILTGIYSGTPETRNMQMLYPLSFSLAILYQMIPFIPWYGVLLLGSQLLCLYLISERCMEFCAKVTGKCLMSCTILFAWIGLFLYRFVFLQYTVTAGILVGTAIFRFMTNYSSDPDEVSFTQDTTRVTQDNMPVGLFVRRNLLNMLMLILGFCLRNEMALLTLPLVGAAFILKWADEKPVFTKQNIEKFLTVALIVIGMSGICFICNGVAYSKGDWGKFKDFFDARTEIYDFSDFLYHPYEDNQEFFESIDVSKEEYQLLVEYDFGLSDHIDHELMAKIADRTIQNRKQNMSMVMRIRNAVWEYFHCYAESRFQPWVFITIILTIAILISAMLQTHYQIFWKFVVLMIMRFICWFYLYFRGRVLDRVTMPLLFVEIMLLVSMLFMEYGIVVIKQNGYNPQLRRMRVLSKWEERREEAIRICPKVALVLILFASMCTVKTGYSRTMHEYQNRELASTFFAKVDAYYKEHQDTFFWQDVYSTTSVTLSSNDAVVYNAEKAFADVSTGYKNADLLGGWINKSPLYEAKLDYAETQMMQQNGEANNQTDASGMDLEGTGIEIDSDSQVVNMLCNGDSCRLVAYKDRDLQFMIDYMAELGVHATLEPVDEIEVDEVKEKVIIYAVRVEEEEQ